MNLSLRARYKKITAIVVLFAVILFLIKSSFNTWLAYSYAQGPQPSGFSLASQTEPNNPDYYFLKAFYLAEYEYGTSRDTAMGDYKKAITLSPFNYNYWFHLAELLYEEGEHEKALYALKKATYLSPGSVSLRWKAGMLASKLGDRDTVLENISAVIENDRKRRTKAFVLLWQSVGDGDRIFDAVSNNALSNYFYYLRSTNRIDEAGRVYEKLKELNYDTSNAANKYTNDLIYKKDIDSAVEVWRDEYGDWEGIWNKGFEENIMNNGFDWIIGREKGLKINRDNDSRSGDYSAKVQFSESERTNFSILYQFVPVRGGKDYEVGLYMKSEDIITSEDLYWQVLCSNSDGLDERSDPVRGSSDWELYRISFTAPNDCKVILLRLTRDNSGKVNKLISGKLWVDDVTITEKATFH